MKLNGGSQDPTGLESVIITAELRQRPSRPPDYQAENSALVGLAKEMGSSPADILQKLVEAILDLCRAQSAGISLLDESRTAFRWPAIAGQWAPHVGGSVPRDFSPCGTVLDRNETMLFSHPERHFTYLAAASPSIEEALLVPFYLHKQAVGTIWAVVHDPDRHFDGEDARVLKSLGEFTAVAYELLRNSSLLT